MRHINSRFLSFTILLNFERQSPASAALYLNMSTTHLQTLQQGQHGQFLSAMHALCSVDPKRIILEISETQFDQPEQLGAIVLAPATPTLTVCRGDKLKTYTNTAFSRSGASMARSRR
jgi:hypothetical protein